MPQCPTCKAPYELGQRYCDQCDSYLLHPEEGDYFCPQCGIRVAPNQEICHKCNATLPEVSAAASAQAQETPEPPGSEPPAPPAAEPPPAAPPTPPPATRCGLPPWGLAAILGAGFLIIIILGLLLRQGLTPTEVAQKPPPPAAVAPTTLAGPATTAAEKPATPAAEKPMPPPEPAPTPEATLADGVRETLNNLREAQLKNDIALFMSCYSYLYPSLDKKRETTLEYWKDFKFLDLNFVLDDVKPMGPDNALARVTWTMQVQTRKSQEFDSFTQVFRVVLAKELGKWRIRSIKDITHGDSE